MGGDLCTAPLLNQRLGAAAHLQPSSVLHYQHHAHSSSHHPGMWVLVMEGFVFGHDAVPCGLQLGVKHLQLWWQHGAGAAWLCCSDIWALAFAGHFPPRANPQISHWIYPVAMGRVMLLAELPSKALPQGLWLRGLFAASSDNRNFRLLIHCKTSRHSLHLVFIRRLDMAWGMQIPCDEEKKIPGLWRCKSSEIRQHYGIILDFFKLRNNSC